MSTIKKPVVSKTGVQKFGTQANTSVKCRFFRNGDKHHTGEEIVIDPRKFNDVDKLKQHLDKAVTLVTGPVLTIKTTNGTTISKLDQLQEGHDYFAVGGEGKINKDNYPTILLKPKSSSPEPQEENLAPQKDHKPVVSGSLGKEKFGTQEEKAIIIQVFKNGDKHDKGHEMKIHSKIFKSYEQVMEKMTTIVKSDTGAIRKVYTPAGKVVKTMSALKDGHQYICVGGEPLNKETLAENSYIKKE